MVKYLYFFFLYCVMMSCSSSKTGVYKNVNYNDEYLIVSDGGVFCFVHGPGEYIRYYVDNYSASSVNGQFYTLEGGDTSDILYLVVLQKKYRCYVDTTSHEKYKKLR
jgi:hypothetical protein